MNDDELKKGIWKRYEDASTRFDHVKTDGEATVGEAVLVANYYLAAATSLALYLILSGMTWEEEMAEVAKVSP